jgi:biofilm protein TabA
MIFDMLSNASHYVGYHPRFKKAFDFLASKDLLAMPPGRVEIDGANVYAMISTQGGKALQNARLETHRKYIDIQVLLHGDESIGWRAAGECVQVEKEYLPDNDIAFFADVPSVYVTMRPGAFAVFFPWDAHAPLIGAGDIQKIVIKIAV